MGNVTVIGAQWGDEGKGKIVDRLSESADVVVRFQGGHNAGHTLVIDGQVYKLSLLPSGVVRQGRLAVIGSGVVIDPWALQKEIDALRQSGVVISPETLAIADNAALILPIHRTLDQGQEALAAPEHRIGTTGRGIGPAYEDKVGRRAVRVCDLADRDSLAAGVEALLHRHAAVAPYTPADRDALIDALMALAPQILPYAQPVWRLLDQRRRAGNRILFEGAQGLMLDVTHGSYPFVTSSNTSPGMAAIGAGCGTQVTGCALGVIKAYATRVGAGPFPTELQNAIGARLGERGREFGTVTGRKRRCGWLDATLARQAAITAGLSALAVTKLDVLDGMAEVRIGVGYRVDGRTLDYLPTAAALQARVEPIYETLPGWSASSEGVRDWDHLPENAARYLRRVEELIGLPLFMVSTSPERDDTILLQDPFAAAPGP